MLGRTFSMTPPICRSGVSREARIFSDQPLVWSLMRYQLRGLRRSHKRKPNHTRLVMWQQDRHAQAAILAVLQGDAAAVGFDDLAGQCQTQSGAVALG